MKSLAIVLLSFMLSACNDGCVRVEKEGSNGGQLELLPGFPFDKVKHFVYEGHSYILFEGGGRSVHDSCTGVVHDPDCKCKEVSK